MSMFGYVVQRYVFFLSQATSRKDDGLLKKDGRIFLKRGGLFKKRGGVF